jgi:transposase
VESLPKLEQLSSQEKDTLLSALWDEVQRLRARIAVLEAKLTEPPKDPHNSSVPPSRAPKANRPARQATGHHRQASVGRAGGGRLLHPDPDQEVVAKAKRCPHCGAAVLAAEQQLQAGYDKSEIPPIKPVVTRVQQYGGQCGQCGQCYMAPVPVGLEPGTPFGASVQSLATYFRYTQAISYERLVGLCGDVFGLSISEGGLANLFPAVQPRLEARVGELLTRLRSSRLVCSDETGARVQGQTQWEWVFQNPEVCIHVIRPSRGQGVIKEVLGEQRPQVWVSDLYSAQRRHPAEDWQVCLAHQLRDCQYALEAGDELFAPRMKAVLLRAVVIHKRRARVTPATLARYQRDLQRRLEQCLALEPEQRHGRRLKKRYLSIKDHLFVFLRDPTVPPTNNSSEQAIRLSTIFRKVTNGFRSDWGRDLFAAVRSVVNTGKRQGLSAYQAIQKALSPLSSFFAPG